MPTSSARSKSEHGTTLIEFAIAALVFFLLLGLVIDCALLGYRTLSIQYVASRTSREGLKDRGKWTPTVPATEAAYLDAIKKRAAELALPLGLKLEHRWWKNRTQIQVCNHRQINQITGRCNCWPTIISPLQQCNTGDRKDDFTIVRIEFGYRMLFKTIPFLLVGESAGKKEMPTW
jgi:hypothetical protein